MNKPFVVLKHPVWFPVSQCSPHASKVAHEIFRELFFSHANNSSKTQAEFYKIWVFKIVLDSNSVFGPPFCTDLPKRKLWMQRFVCKYLAPISVHFYQNIAQRYRLNVLFKKIFQIKCFLTPFKNKFLYFINKINTFCMKHNFSNTFSCLIILINWTKYELYVIHTNLCVCYYFFFY